MTVDCNVTLGAWPFRRLAHNTPETFLELMLKHQMRQAWTSSFEGIFYKSAFEANEDFQKRVAGFEQRMIHVPAVNPTYPIWEDELAEYVSWGVPGVRVYPSYHGYELADPAFETLLEKAAEAKLFIQIVVRVQDERLHHPLAKVAPVNLGAVTGLANRYPSVPLMVLGANNMEVGVVAPAGCPCNVYLDISNIEGVGGVGGLVDSIGANAVIFGSHAPFLYLDSAVLKMKEADLTDEDREAVLRGNAEAIVGKSR